MAGPPPGASYRQFDHWTRQGWLGGGTPGSGHKRTDEHERQVANLAAHLVGLGLRPQVAIQAVRNGNYTVLFQLLLEAQPAPEAKTG